MYLSLRCCMQDRRVLVLLKSTKEFEYSNSRTSWASGWRFRGLNNNLWGCETFFEKRLLPWGVLPLRGLRATGKGIAVESIERFQHLSNFMIHFRARVLTQRMKCSNRRWELGMMCFWYQAVLDIPRLRTRTFPRQEKLPLNTVTSRPSDLERGSRLESQAWPRLNSVNPYRPFQKDEHNDALLKTEACL